MAWDKTRGTDRYLLGADESDSRGVGAIKRPAKSLRLDNIITVVYTLVMKTVINIKADKDVKEKAQKLAKELGLPLSTLINSYLKQFLRNKEVYFSAAPKMTPNLEVIIEEARRDLKHKRNLSPVLSSPEEIDAYLKAL